MPLPRCRHGTCCRADRTGPAHISTPTTRSLASSARAAGGLRFPLRVATYQTLIGLLAVTAMRVGEAIRLDREDLDLRAGLLVVRNTKFGKTRELPLHPTTVAALRAYLGERDRHQPAANTPAVFISLAGTRLPRSAGGGGSFCKPSPATSYRRRHTPT
jgi:integrase